MFEMALHTITHRWYVFAFLLSYLFLAGFYWGLKPTLKLLILGYAIAWASEALSIRTGFPYGMYFYHYEAMAGEPMVFGVPFWDSLSYPFLCFAGFQLASFLRFKANPKKNPKILFGQWKTVFYGALFTTLLDVIIDPVAHQGSKWFLGDIYHYPEGAWYFDVPLSNFAGWLLVSFLILSAFRLSQSGQIDVKREEFLKLSVLFYFGIFFFNYGVTFWIGDYTLALVDSLWLGLLLILVFGKKNVFNPT